MYYLFVDDESGENFFVEAENRNEATEIAFECFEEPRLVDVMTEKKANGIHTTFTDNG